MRDKGNKVRAQIILDDVAAESMTSSEGQLREQLRDADIDSVAEVRALRLIAQRAVETYRQQKIDALPDSVPNNPEEMRALLDQLLAMPSAPKQAFTVAFRERSGTSENDVRLLTEHLLELLKKQT